MLRLGGGHDEAHKNWNQQKHDVTLRTELTDVTLVSEETY